jgi:23S rRNA (guanine745-N1)-methyltransferase
MVSARAEFLGTGHFTVLAERLAGLVSAAREPACVLDAGAGTGYYLGRALSRTESAVGIALDLSKYALRRAAREHPRIGAVVCDLWQAIPVRSGAADVILNVFAPRNGAEFARVLSPDGLLLVVTPTARHLTELVGPLGLLSVDEQKRDRVEQSLGEYFRLVGEESCEMSLSLGRSDIETLVGMGPSAHHVGVEELRARIGGLEALVSGSVSVSVTASFTLSTFVTGTRSGPAG